MADGIFNTTGYIDMNVLIQNRWINTGLDFFSPFNGPHTLRDVCLRKHALAKLFRRQFEYVSRNLFLIEHIRSSGSINRETREKAMRVYLSTLLNATESANRMIAQARVLMKATGVVENVEPSTDKALAAPITSIGADKFVDLFHAVDKFYELNDLLLLNEQIDKKTKFGNESTARSLIVGATKGVASQFQYVLNRQNDDALGRKNRKA